MTTLSVGGAALAPTRVATLRAELRDDAPWVASSRPRLTWTVEAARPDWVQAWAEIRSGSEIARRDGDDSVLVPWPFGALQAGEQRTVSVRVGSTAGEVTAWSRPLTMQPAFVEEWVARPIGLAEPDAIARPALLRAAFRIDAPVRRAVLHYTALGVADVVLNGTDVDDVVMAPGWTSYDLRTVHETADVTHILRAGENVLAARLAGAWFTEEYHVLTRPARHHGDQPRLLAQLHLELEDGSRQVVATDGSWRSVPDPVTVTSGLYNGEHADARGSLDGWDEPGFDDSSWPAAAVTDVDVPRPEPRSAPPVRRLETIAASRMLHSGTGAPILDFGQNLVGRLRIRVSGAAGTVITLRHAEVLDGGELATRPLRLAKATDMYVLSGDGVETWEPRFTFHGFRYAQIDGWPGELDMADVEAVVLGTDLRRIGWFHTSDELLARFHENVVWTARGNYLAVPMDCPQRDERLGWTGDTQLFAPTATFLYDCAAFYRSWMRDLVLEQQRAGGIVPLFAPTVVPDFATRGPIAAWGDAIVIIPHVLWEMTGDTDLLAELYPAMRDWLDVVLPARDEDGLWTAGRQLGDWLDPNAPPNAPARGRTDTDIVATAYVVRTARLAAEIATLLGRTEDAVRFEQEAERSRRAFASTYVTPAGRMVGDTQTAYALTIAFDLVDDPDLRQRLADRLADVVRRDGFHIATGLCGTAVVAQALTAGGHLEAAERLLMQTESPSWLYPVTVGATTVWERWDGLQQDGSLNPGAMVSFNHVALGSVAAFLHRQIAGLAPAAPGYRRLQVHPHVLRRIDDAHVEHETPYGRAASGWRREDDEIVVTATVPANTMAEVTLPGGQRLTVGSGRHEWRVAEQHEPRRRPVTLDSSMADLADDEHAYAAFYRALDASSNRFVAKAIRGNAIYRPTLTIRDALIFADADTLAGVEHALADVDQRSVAGPPA